MYLFRTSSARFALAVLAWQLAVLLVLPTALCCAAVSADHGASPACPMHHEPGAACPMHASTRSSDASGPRLGCSLSDRAFLALFGPIGILSGAPPIGEPARSVRMTEGPRVNVEALAVTPVAPPPRS